MNRIEYPPEAAPPQASLLGLFAAFYEEVARIKAQAARGALADYLADGGPTAATPEALAKAASARLAALLAAQRRQLRQCGTEAELKLHHEASYVWVAVADEALLFDLAGPGQPAWQSAWLGALLEQRLFGTRLAGQHFFERAEAVLASPMRDALHRDLAASFLLALQLGFKGRHRSARGCDALERLRERLWHFVHGRSPPTYAPGLFPQASAHTLVSARDERIAPTAPWLRAAHAWAWAFVVLSSLIWLWLVQPLARPSLP